MASACCERGLGDGHEPFGQRGVVEGLCRIEHQLGAGRRQRTVGDGAPDGRQTLLGGDAAAGIDRLREREVQSERIGLPEGQIGEVAAAEPAVTGVSGVSGEQPGELGLERAVVGGPAAQLGQPLAAGALLAGDSPVHAELRDGDLFAAGFRQVDHVVERQGPRRDLRNPDRREALRRRDWALGHGRRAVAWPTSTRIAARTRRRVRSGREGMFMSSWRAVPITAHWTKTQSPTKRFHIAPESRSAPPGGPERADVMRESKGESRIPNPESRIPD